MDSETGLLTPVERIVERRSRIPTFDKSKGIVPVTPLAWIATGRKECLRLTTHAGHELGVTPEHPMLTVDGWKPAGELQPDEYIAAASEMPFAETVVELPDSEVLVLAALLAEGCYSQSFVTFTNDDPEIVRVVDQALMQAVGGRLHHYESQKSWDYRVKSPLDRGTSRVRRLLLEHGMGYKTAPHKTVPDAVFRLGRRQLGLFLGMLWSCDGSVQKNGVLTLGMSSEKLVRQVQHLLLRLGICSTMRSKIARCNGKTFSAWELAVSSTGKARFKELVPMVGQKVERLASLPDHQNPNDDLVPLTDGVRRLLRDAAEQFESVGGDWGEIARSLGWEPGNFGRARLTRRANLSKRVLAAFVEASGAEELRWLLRVRWERIVKVEAVGERDVYDFTVADTHCFVANDLVAHNTFSGVDIALNAWAQGYRVLVISPEMTKEEIAERFFSMYAKVPYAGVVNGGLLMHAEEHLKQTIESVKGMEGFWIVDADDHLDTGDIEQAVEMLKPHLLVLDSVYMLNPGGKGDRHEKIIKVVEWASHFCKRAYDGEGIPILGISQLARPKKKDTSGSISGSAASQNMVEQLRDQLALSDAILWYVHNLFGIVQDDDMRADKQLLYVPLKIRRAVFRKEVRVRWDMDEMDFSEIGVSAEDGYQDDDFDAASKTGL
jgi:replicative DNA helicase